MISSTLTLSFKTLQYVNPLCAEAETKLFEKIYDAKVYMEPASAFFSDQHGWFRICFGFPEYLVVEGKPHIFSLINFVFHSF